MRKALVSLGTLVVFATCSWGAEFPIGPTRQVVPESQSTRALKQDPWEKDRWNFIDPRTGLRTGGFIQRDRWEPRKRFNVYDKQGRNTGVIKQDRYEKDRWNEHSGSETSTFGIGEYNDGIGGN